MGYWKMHIFVILPQALKLVIPGIANTFLALVTDTPLIFVVGLLELVGMLNLAKTNPKWLGFSMEGYVFAGIIFWIICYSMSKNNKNSECVDLDLVEQGYLYAWLEKTYDFLQAPLTRKFFTNTKEINEYVTYYPKHYKAMNPNLPMFNNIANPFYLWNKNKTEHKSG